MLQPMILKILLCMLMGSLQNLPQGHSSLGLLKFSSSTHSHGTLFETRSSTFTTQQPRSATTLWLLACFFRENRTGRDSIDTGHEPTKLPRILSCLGSFLTTRSRRYDNYKDSLSEIPFRHQTHTQGHMECYLLVGLEPDSYQNKVIHTLF